MDNQTLEKMYTLLNILDAKKENKEDVALIKRLLENNQDEKAVELLDKLTAKLKSGEAVELHHEYKKVLLNDLERIYIGLLLNDPKLISKYYFLYDNCFFEDEDLSNIYKRILFTDGQSYAPVEAKERFTFAKNPEKLDPIMDTLKKSVDLSKYDIEKIYIELSKLFEIRKNCIKTPIGSIQEKLNDITNYKLYDHMSLDEIKAAINQVTVTSKFKPAVLNKDLTDFINLGDNDLINGLDLPFPIMNYVFKGIRKGETMAIAMPSNAGKSRFTINLATIVAIFHKKKILIISNEMSEEKMKLCFITTIINNPVIQELHGHKLKKSEGEILEYKYRPDKGAKVALDENGYILRGEEETQEEFIEKLSKYSSEYKEVIAVTDWVNKETENAISFMNITDHTNDELRKVITNYYYKEEVEYVFYDTLKTDVNNIASPEELKRTATILTNLSQTFKLFIFATLQLQESSTSPLNLNVNDLAVSRTVKEVLDTLTLVKQLNRDTLDEYEYSEHEVDTVFHNLEKFDDPDVRYYSFVVDKNRAGAKPTLLFRLNLAYNMWEELGYLRLKQTSNTAE
ncbi:MAG: hypothetical protein FWF46_02685 [Oscillospiraceae bacterium]|nr:hypothetical protein [Oscillospiraceae bacterium]